MDIFSLKVEKEYFHISSNLDKNNTSFIYGEVCCKNLSEILLDLELNDRLFLDIGSGCGKIVLYLTIKLNMNAEGLEIDIERFNQSIKLQEDLNLIDKILFYNEDFVKVYFGNYDIIYCCNLVFSDEDNLILYQKLLKEFKGVVFLFNYNNQIGKFFIKKYNIKTSWNKKQEMFVFLIE